MILDGRVRAELAAATRFADVRLMDEVDSTNRVVAELAAAGAPEGVVVAADFQSAGRGRLDRGWDARPGDGLLVSVLVRPALRSGTQPAGLPPERLHLVTAAAALAGREACLEIGGIEPEIKWPNDLLLDGSKLAGILAEAAAGAVVVGMGLNVHSGPPGAAVLDRAAGSRVSRAALLEQWLRSLDRLLGDWDRVASDYRRLCATVGRPVSIELSGGQVLTAEAEAVDEQGRLVVRDEEGRRHVVAAGDVHHLR